MPSNLSNDSGDPFKGQSGAKPDPLKSEDIKKIFKLLKKPTNFKKFGQNFLLDRTTRDKIIEAADLSKNDQVLEVGPGAGVLTVNLIQKVARVVAIDIDPFMLEATRITTGAPKNLELKLQDIRKINLQALFCAGRAGGQKNSVAISRSTRKTGSSGESCGPGGQYVVVSNLPFLLTGYIFKLLLTSACSPKRIVVMVQKEVGQRILASPGQHSLLSLSVNIFGRPQKVLDVSHEAFWPEPKVDSMVVRIDRLARPRVSSRDQKIFFRVARAGFSSRRKTLTNSLAGGLKLGTDQVKKALSASGIELNARAQELSVEEWAALSQKIAKLL